MGKVPMVFPGRKGEKAQIYKEKKNSILPVARLGKGDLASASRRGEERISIT